MDVTIDNQNIKNEIQFKKIINKLRKAREGDADVELHLEGLSELIENQQLILKTCNFEMIEFEFFFDLIYDYGSTLCYVRDDLLIFKSAIRWLTYPQLSKKREQFTKDIMNSIKFDDMKENELKQCFGILDTCKLSNQLKDFLQNIQCQMIANHKINFESLFVDCFKV